MTVISDVYFRYCGDIVKIKITSRKVLLLGIFSGWFFYPNSVYISFTIVNDLLLTYFRPLALDQKENGSRTVYIFMIKWLKLVR